jgi:hypothetical protein
MFVMLQVAGGCGGEEEREEKGGADNLHDAVAHAAAKNKKQKRV